MSIQNVKVGDWVSFKSNEKGFVSQGIVVFFYLDGSIEISDCPAMTGQNWTIKKKNILSIISEPSFEV